MQTPNLPIQVNSAAPAPQAARAKPGSSEGNGQFSAALSREMDQRKSAVMPAPAAPPKPAGPVKPQQAQQPAQARPADKAAAPKTATPDKPAAKASEKTDTADKADAAAEAAGSAQAAAASPVVEMLNLVASFNQPGAGVAADAAALATDPLPAAGGQRARLELAVDGAPMPLPAAARSPVAGLAMTDAAPELAGEAVDQAPQAAFAGMMAKAGGALPDGLEQAAEPGKDAGLVAERGAPQAGLERAAPGKAADPSSAVPGQLRSADALPNASLRAREAAAEPSPVKDLQVNAPATAPLQQAALHVAQVAGGLAAGDKIPARVGTPAWDNQVAQKIVWMVGGAEQTASLTLNPPDLGPMQVVLSVTNDMASVTFSSGQLEVRQALEDAMPKLREMMSENGIALGNASVNDGSQEQQQQADGQAARRGGSAGGADNGPANGSAADAEARNNARPQRVGQTQGMVDTFA